MSFLKANNHLKMLFCENRQEDTKRIILLSEKIGIFRGVGIFTNNKAPYLGACKNPKSPINISQKYILVISIPPSVSVPKSFRLLFNFLGALETISDCHPPSYRLGGQNVNHSKP